MVLGELFEPAVAQPIGTRVADARHEDPVEPKLGQHHGRPHVGELGDRAGAAQDLLIDLGNRVADRFLDPAGLLLVGRQPAGDRPGDQLDGHQAGLLAGLLAPHAVGHDEQIGGLERERGHLAVALRTAVVPHRPPAGNEEIVFVVLAVVSPDRDHAHPQLELARQERERRESGELLGRGVVVVRVSAGPRGSSASSAVAKTSSPEVHPSARNTVFPLNGTTGVLSTAMPLTAIRVSSRSRSPTAGPDLDETSVSCSTSLGNPIRVHPRPRLIQRVSAAACDAAPHLAETDTLTVEHAPGWPSASGRRRRRNDKS